MSVEFIAGVLFGAAVSALGIAVLIVRLAGWWRSDGTR
jgi:hypothetical protein